MRYAFAGMAVAFLMLASAMLLLDTTSANACNRHDVDCERSTDGVRWNGKGRMKELIHGVTVCHKYFHLVDVGTYKGQRAKWWMPVMKRGEWYGDLEGYFTECTTFKDFTPGTEVRLYASCVERLITTGPIYAPGKYYLD